jgi:anti-sigma regulatory factor (Ser/Thr protein kinase)
MTHPDPQPDVLQQHRLTLPTTAASVTVARHSAQSVLVGWGLPASSTVDAVLLIATELLTNAVRHAERSTHVDLTLRLGAREVTVGVHDEDPRLPPWPPTATSTGGLRVLAHLLYERGGRWDLRPDFARPGKTISATLPRNPT